MACVTPLEVSPSQQGISTKETKKHLAVKRAATLKTAGISDLSAQEQEDLMKRASTQALAAAFDLDGDGVISPVEAALMAAAMNKHIKKKNRLQKYAGASLVAFFAVAIAVVVLIVAQEASKENHTVARELVDKEGKSVRTEASIAYTTLADIPSRSQEFIQNMRTITYDYNGVIETSAVSHVQWFDRSTMTIYLQFENRKIFINGPIVSLSLPGGKSYGLSGAAAGSVARRRLIDVLGPHEPRAYSMEELQRVAQSLADGLGLDERRRLSSSSSSISPFSLLFKALGGLCASGISVDTANEGAASPKDRPTPVLLKFPPNSLWTMTMNDGAKGKWFLSFDLKGMTGKLQVEQDYGTWVSVEEMHDGGHYRYNTMPNLAFEEEPGTCEGLDVDALNTTCEEYKKAMLTERKHLAESFVGLKEHCEVVSSKADTTIEWKVGYEFLHRHNDDGGAVWNLGILGVKSDSKGVPVNLVDLDTNDVIATIHTVDELSTKDMTDMKLFQGCKEGEETPVFPTSEDRLRRRLQNGPLSKEREMAHAVVDELLDQSGVMAHPEPRKRQLLTLTEIQAWMSGTQWCGAGTDLNTDCPDPAIGDTNPSYDFLADTCCRRHDHGSKSVTIGIAVRLGCDIDLDLADCTTNWAAQAVFGKWGIANTWGCFDEGKYGCFETVSTWWGGYIRWTTCKGEHVQYGPFRYDDFSKIYGYIPKEKVCQNDIW